MSIDVASKSLKILIIREASKRQGIPQVGSAIKVTVGLEWRLHVAISTENRWNADANLVSGLLSCNRVTRGKACQSTRHEIFIEKTE